MSFYLARTITTLTQLRQIALLFSVSALSESLLAIAQYLNQGSLNGIFYFFGERAFNGSTPGIANASINGVLILRPYATFPHPNVLAGYLLVVIIFVWNFFPKTDRFLTKGIVLSAFLLGSIALLLTYSRIAILLWMFLVLLALFREGARLIKTTKVKLLVSVGVVAVLLCSSLLPITHELSARFTQTSLTDESIIERTELLSSAWKMIEKHPFLGVGVYNFIPSLAPLQKPLPLGLYLQPVHNIFVLVTAETGLVGIGVFLWVLVRIGIQISTAKPEQKKAFFLIFTVIIVTGMFDHYWLTLQQGQLLFATMIGLTFSKARQ